MKDDSYWNTERWWIFTFGYGQKHAGKYVKIWGTHDSARNKMFEKYGSEWSFQHSLEDWNNWIESKPGHVVAETELEVINGPDNVF